jgi:hypothetical protein
LALFTVLTDNMNAHGIVTDPVTINGNVGYVFQNHPPAGTFLPTVNGNTYYSTTSQYTTAYTGVNGLDDPLTGTIVDIQGRTSSGTLPDGFPSGPSYTLEPGVYDFPNGLSINHLLQLDGQGNSDSIFIFRLGNNQPLAIGGGVSFGVGVLLINGALAQNVFFYAPGSSNTITISGDVEVNGIFICDNQITLDSSSGILVGGDGMVLNGNLWTANSGNVSFIPGTNGHDSITVNGEAQAFTGADPHVICLDGSRLDVYDAGFYRLCQFDDFTLNVEVARNKHHTDYYKYAYIEHGSKKITVRFVNSGLIIDDSDTTLPKVDKWSYTYKNKNIYFTVIFEKAHKTIGLKTNKIGKVTMSGLCTGEIISIGHLRDVSITSKKIIQIPNYDLNALLSGSNDPHIVTTQGKKLEVSDNYFRLLEFGSNVINCHVNSRGEIDQLQMISGSDNQTWLWTGDKHWDLKCYHNGKVVDRTYKFEQLLRIGHSEILFRVQANGSVSAGFKNTGCIARGLFTNDIVKLSGLDDQSVHVYGQIEENLIPDLTASMYVQKMEKHMAQI